MGWTARWPPDAGSWERPTRGAQARPLPAAGGPGQLVDDGLVGSVSRAQGNACHEPLATRGRKGSHPHPRHSRARAGLGDPKRPQWPQRPVRPREQRPTTGQLFPPLPPDAQRTKPQSGQHQLPTAAPWEASAPSCCPRATRLRTQAKPQTEQTERTRMRKPRPQPASERLVHGPRGKVSRGLAGTGASATPVTSAKGFGTLLGEVTSMF